MTIVCLNCAYAEGECGCVEAAARSRESQRHFIIAEKCMEMFHPVGNNLDELAA